MQHVALDMQKKNAIRRAIMRLALVTLLCGCDATPAPVAQSATTQPVTKLTPPFPGDKFSGEGWEMIVNASIGRITSFGKPGGRNLLWVNESPEPIGRNKEWIDWGGDKVWPSPQEQWPKALGRKWPPGSAYEGGAWQWVVPAEQSFGRQWVLDRWEASLKNIEEKPLPNGPGSSGVRSSDVPRDKEATGPAGLLFSNLVTEIGVGIGRSIKHSRPGWVHVDTTITRGQPRDVDTHVWNISQVRVPEFAILSKGDLAFSQDEPIVRFRDTTIDTQEIALPEKGRSCVVVRPSSASGKIGTMGRWVAAVYPDVIFVQAIDQARPGRYADRSSVQVLASSTFWELETLGRSDILEVGATRALRVRWGLLDRVAGEELPEMVKRIQSAVEAK